MNKNDSIFLNICIAISTTISLIIAYIFFCHHQKWSMELNVATDIIGQYGDFIGGVIGTLLSVALLYYTLNQQRNDSYKNARVYKKQQLNDDFYHMMDLYNNIIGDLQIPDETQPFKGKEAINACVESIREGFDVSINMAKRKLAIMAYMDFYAKYRYFAPIYFRTLYRLCEILHDKEIETDYKNIEYIKILRAQLSDSEMVLLRYNALTPMGKNFRYYINRFNLLKHLPPLDLFEYTEWRKVLQRSNIFDVSAMNVILVELRQHITDILDNDKKTHTMVDYKSNATISIQKSTNYDTLSLCVHRNKVNVLNNYDNYNCIMRLDEEYLKSLFKYFLYDSIVLSNFQEFNNRKELEFSEDIIENTNKKIYKFIVRNKEQKRINVSWAQLKK